MYRLPGAEELLASLHGEESTVHVEGIERAIMVHALRPRR
jgi:hypothetical protein